jgi:hypothetical protein
MYKLLLILFFLSVTTIAQTTKSSISGKVVTETGEVLPGVSVFVTHLATGTIYGCSSNAYGAYYLPELKPGGPYLIEFSRLNYKKHQVSGIFLKLDQPLILNINLLAITNTLAEIKIESTAGSKTSSAEKVGMVYHTSQRSIEILPSIKRSISDFIKLSPQAYGAAIAGGNYRQNFITIDGSEFNNNFGVGENLPGNGAQPVALDAIAEISVNTAPFNSIWESGFIGSAVNIVSRTGSNNTTGAIYTYFHNQNNYGYQVDHTPVEKRPVSYHLEGFRIGGPILKNQLFYFFNFEQEQEQYQPQIFEAATTANPYGSSSNIARPTADELNNISNFLAVNYGYVTGPYQDYSFNNKSHKLLARLDWNIAKNNTFSIRYNQLQSRRPEMLNGSRSPLTPFSSSSGRRTANALSFSHSNFITLSNFYSLAAEWNTQISNNLSNTVRSSYTRQHEPRTSESQPFPFIDILKDGVPFTSFGYEPFTYGNKRDVTVLSITDQLHWKQRNNLWIAGFQADYSKTKNSYMPFGTGYYTYASWDDFATGKSPVDYALTYPINNQQKIPEYSFDYLNLSAFIQQNMSFNDRMKLTIGLRADLATFPQELAQNALLATLRFADNLQLNTSQLPKPSIVLAPRLAFKYDITKDKVVQLHVGTGLFTGRIPYVWIISQARYSGMYQLTQTSQGQQNVPGPFNAVQQYSSANEQTTSLPSITSVLSRDFKMPQAWKSNLGIVLNLSNGFTATVDAIFNQDIRGIYFRNVNLNAPVPLNISGYPDHRLVYPASNAQKYINPLNSAGVPEANATAALNAVYVYNSSKGYYFTSIAQIEKRISNRLNFSLAYARSTARNYNDGDGDQTLSALHSTPSVNGINDPALGYAGYVMPDKVASTLTYSVNYAKNLKFSVGLVYQGLNEGRFSYTYANDFTRDGTNKSLIYIPLNPSEIRFSPFNVQTGATKETFSSQQQSDAFFSYVEQDKYLRTRKGQYAERNGVLLPWRHQFDLKLSHDLYLDVKGQRHIIQLTCDVLNLGNLIHHSWGLKKIANTSSILIPSNLDEVKPNGNTIPTFNLATVGGKLPIETFRNDFSVNSTYLMQFGIRYLFD